MNKKSVLIIAAVFAVLVLAFIIFSRPENTNTALTATVSRGPFEILVYSTGQLESENSDNILIPERMNDRQIRISSLTITDMVDEGTYVKQGDYVATLDHQAVEEQKKLALDDLERTLSEYEDSKIDSNLTLSNQRDVIVNARLDLEEKEIAVQESAFEAPSVQRKGEMDLDKAKRKLEQVIAAYELITQQETNKVTRKFINYKQVRERVDALNQLIDALIIYSPRAGIISYYQYQFGGTVKTGSNVSQWNPIIATFPDMNNLITKTFINEIDISLIKKGQKVKVGIDAFPEKELTGEVIAVANMGQLMPNSDAKVFEIKIKVNGSDPELKPAMTTSNTIQTNAFTDTLFVPIESVFTNDSLSFVYLADGKNTKQIIEPGEENENFVVVRNGLTEGQQIYLTEPENAENFALAGFEIYNDILRKNEEEKAKKAEAEKMRQMEQKPMEMPAGVKMPNATGTVIVSQ
ncbi:MAG TPA: HlyD family efflux transporter periplasmic adaptor subunit [Draconibacterium sp.]|nr:HlyD family efflux transporter periplasmic adaptor subunit [Draconibacterium sp.]